MTSVRRVNLIFVLRAALAARRAKIGADVAQRALYNDGQACLKPAILLAAARPSPQELRDAATAEMEKVARPVTYQNFPDDLLPQPLRERNPLRPWRLVDGGLTQQ
jgi:hypothetical protein